MFNLLSFGTTVYIGMGVGIAVTVLIAVFGFIMVRKAGKSATGMIKDYQEQKREAVREEREHELRKIEAMQEKAEDKKTAYKCPSCGAVLEQKTGYMECPFCGAKKK